MSVSIPTKTLHATLRAPSSRAHCEPGGGCGGACPCARPCAAVDENSGLMALGEPVRLRRGDQLWAQGQAADALYVLCTGAVKLTRKWPDGREMILDLSFRGDLLGEQSAVPGTIFETNAVALASGKAIRLEGATLRRLLSTHPEHVRRLLDVSVGRQAAFARRLDELNHGPVESRLARVLLRIGEQVGLKDSRGVFVPVHFSRGDLADLVGCRVETIIRVMTRWQREEVVETHREGIVLRCRDALEESAREAAAA